MAPAVTVAVLVTACAGSPSTPGVAAGSTAATTRSHPAGSNSPAQGLVAYASCVREHGVPNFPDPDSRGVFPKTELQQLGVGPSRFRAETQVCNHLLPAGGSGQTFTAQQQQDYLKGASCMRSHGIASFPDPKFLKGTVTFPIPSSIDTHSAQFTQAEQICRKLIPAGLPYSEPGS